MKLLTPDLSSYPSLGAALRTANSKWANHLALIEADRDRENHRLTYSEFNSMALKLADSLQSSGFKPGQRGAILMSNQSKWLVSAYAIFYCGGILVPLDFKLTPSEHYSLLKHAKSKVLITEYPLWMGLNRSIEHEELTRMTVVVTEAPDGEDLKGAHHWKRYLKDKLTQPPQFQPRNREDIACIVYSSGTGGNPKGCLLTHDNYLKQCQSLMSWYPFWPGMRYLSILPTNHAIDFMVGFIGPFICGATVVHLRTLRPEYLRTAFPQYKIAYVSVVPMILNALETNLKIKFSKLSTFQHWILKRLIDVNRLLTSNKPRPALSRKLLPKIHEAFGGHLRAFITGGAFANPATLQFFYNLGIPVVNGYGLTESGTAVTVNDLKPFRSDTVGKPLPGVTIDILEPDQTGIGQIAVKSQTIMKGYLNEPQLTAQTIKNGTLLTGDLGWIDSSGHLHLVGRLKNMIVTSGGKNIYPEDIEANFNDIDVKEFCIFSVNYVWKRHSLKQENLMIVLRLESNVSFTPLLLKEIRNRNFRLSDFRRVSSYLLWQQDFPRTASLKIKRDLLAESIAKDCDPELLTNL